MITKEEFEQRWIDAQRFQTEQKRVADNYYALTGNKASAIEGRQSIEGLISEIVDLKLYVAELESALSDVVHEMYDIDRGDCRARPCIKRAEAILPIALGGER